MFLPFNSIENIIVFAFLIGLMIWVFRAITQDDTPNSRHSNGKGSETITLLVHEKPRISLKSSRDEGGKDNYSLSIPSSIEEIVLNVTEKDHDLSVELESVKRRETYIGQTEPHDIWVILKENGKEESQLVTIPPSTEEFNFLIREKDHKISVEVESLKKQDNNVQSNE